MKPIQDLDKRYLEFRDKTVQLFSEYPLLEPLRYFVFRELLIQHKVITWKDFIKHWLRPLVRRGRTRNHLNEADVLIWIESCREVIVDALLPVYRQLVSGGTKVQLASFGGPKDLPAGTLNFLLPADSRPPSWAKNAWEALCDAFDELHSRSLERSFRCACANVQSLSDEMERMLDVVKPKVTLNASMQLPGGAVLSVVSHQRGSSTLLLQHGILQPFYTPVVADYMLTWGQSSDETLARFGAPTQRLIALGSPRHDSMGVSSNGNAKAILRRSVSVPEGPTFVFFSNGNDLARNGEAPIECAKWLEQVAIQYARELNVIVRLHPNEDGSLYRDCKHVRITKNFPDLGTTLDGSDWVGSLCSTVLYDALLYKKPIWQFHSDGWPDLAYNWKEGLALRISSPEALSASVRRILDDGSHSTTDKQGIDRVFANHGQATQAVADFVQGQLERNQGTDRFHQTANLTAHDRLS